MDRIPRFDALRCLVVDTVVPTPVCVHGQSARPNRHATRGLWGHQQLPPFLLWQLWPDAGSSFNHTEPWLLCPRTAMCFQGSLGLLGV